MAVHLSQAVTEEDPALLCFAFKEECARFLDEVVGSRGHSGGLLHNKEFIWSQIALSRQRDRKGTPCCFQESSGPGTRND